MKKPKKAKIITERIVEYKYSVVCPHCKTTLENIDKFSLMMECWHCHSPIDLRGRNGLQNVDYSKL